MTRYRPALLAVALLFAAGPASATTPSTTPDCAEHGHDAEHNPHCDTTTTSSSTTTTTTLIPGLPANPTTTTSATTTTSMAPAMIIEPPHLDAPPATVAATTTTTAAPEVLSTHVDKLPRTGTPVAFCTAVGLLCLVLGAAALHVRRLPGT